MPGPAEAVAAKKIILMRDVDFPGNYNIIIMSISVMMVVGFGHVNWSNFCTYPSDSFRREHVQKDLLPRFVLQYP